MIGRIKRKVLQEIKRIRSDILVKRTQFQTKLSSGTFSFSSPPRLDCPLRCNGSGLVHLGDKVSIGYNKAPKYGNGEILLQARRVEAKINIGSGTMTSNNISIIACSEISIGMNCQIGDQVAIYDCDFHEINPDTRNDSAGEVDSVKIGNNVWLGSRVMILKGVSIGDNSVVAAGSIVTKSIPSNCLSAGSPAKVIRKI
ncbi:acyltransferase [Shewanella sp. WPAGA9]|uniref:acyltransferase n=1 Tax=Shewanella sp. ENK2 TaxID=2775245 RepID=UPI00177DC395|nr:acyltransferase [Shewanella sp. WPAGA9]